MVTIKLIFELVIIIRMRHLIVIIGILGLSACSFFPEEKEKLRLEGDWIYVEDTTGLFSRYDLGLRFRDSTLLTIKKSALHNRGKYSLDQDKILVQEFGGIISSYQIIEHLPDTLTLSHNSKTRKLYNRRLEFNSDLKFEKISLVAGSCFGYCPEFIFTIQSDGKANFKGINNVKLVGDTVFRIENQTLQNIDSLFKRSYIDNLDTTANYWAMDDWSLNITFHYNESKSKTIDGTYMFMPFRLKGIIRRMLTTLVKEELIKG